MPESDTVSCVTHHIGVGLRHPHYEDFLRTRQDVAFLEVHSENYFCSGKNLVILLDIAQNYPLSLHGVGLSLGSHTLPDTTHLQRLKRLISQINPTFVSDHVSWSAATDAQGQMIHTNDLLPLPYTEESLNIICRNIDHAQHALNHRLLIENPSSYVQFDHSTMAEQDFLRKIVKRTGCQLILDVNNVYVQSYNHGNLPEQYINHLPHDAIAEIHLAGHVKRTVEDTSLLIDTHSQPVCDEVWSLYCHAIACAPQAWTLVEWDSDIPPLDILLDQAQKAALLHHKTLTRYDT